MLAATLNRSGSMGETPSDTIEAGVSTSSSEGIGGTLEQFPSALFPAVRPCFADPDIERVRIEAGIDCSKVRIDPNLTFTIVAQPLPEPTPSIVEAASARISQQGGSLTESEAIEALRAAGAPEEWIPAFIAIGQCESHLSPGAKGDGGNSLGWLQMWRGWGKAIGVEPEALHDPVTNARAGVYVRTVRGRFGGGGGWSCADHLGIP